MQIIRIEAFLVVAELIKPYISALDKHGMTQVNCVVLLMETDGGLIGIGESNPHIAFTSESPESVMQILNHYIGPAVLGMDPRNLAALHMKMDAIAPGFSFAKAAVDVAAHDILGKALGVPVYQLLGGKLRSEIPMIWAIGGGTVEENVQEAVTRVAEGFGTLHVKLGAQSVATDLARIQAIREAVGNEVFIMVDINQGWDRSTAIRAVRELEKYRLSIIEQPVPAWDVDGLARVQAAAQTPISADEALGSNHQMIDLIRRDAARAFSLKTGKCGGLFRTRQIAAMAEAAGLVCFVNSMIEMGISVAASLHLSASVPNLIGHGHALMSNLRIKEDILMPDSFAYNGKSICVPDHCEGLGVTIDESRLARRTREHFELTI